MTGSYNASVVNTFIFVGKILYKPAVGLSSRIKNANDVLPKWNGSNMPNRSIPERHDLKTFSKRLQRNNFSYYKTSSTHLEDVLQRRLEDISQDILKTSWKTKNCYAEDVFKTPWRHIKCLLGISVSIKSKSTSSKSISQKSLS